MILKLYRILGKKYIFKSVTIFFVILSSFLLELINMATFVPILSFISNPEGVSEYKNLIIIKKILGSEFLNYLKNYFFGEFNFKFFIIIFLIIYIIKSFFILLGNYLIANFSFLIKQDISSNLYYDYLNKDYSFYLKKNTSELLNNITNLVDRLSLSVMSFLIIFSELIIICAVFMVLFFIKSKETIYLAGFLIFFSFIYFYFLKKRIINWGSLNNFLESERIRVVQESLLNIKEILIRSNQNFFSEIYKKIIKKNVKINILFTILNTTPRLYLEIILVIIISIIILSQDNISINTEMFIFLSMLVVGFLRALPSFNKILANAQYLSFAKKSIDIIFDDISLKKKNLIIQEENEVKKIKFEKKLKLKNLQFSYSDNDKRIFDNFNLSINAGEFILISGSSGSGKSTFVNLLSGLIKPNAGEILVDDFDIVKNKTNWQSKIGYVSQQVFLLNESIPVNIALKRSEDIVSSEIKNIINLVELNSVYERFGDEGKIGERGSKLSGGQIQRLAIARALYNSPKVLILDESTNSLDSDTELTILKTLKNIKLNMTILFISHKKYDLDIFDQEILINQ